MVLCRALALPLERQFRARGRKFDTRVPVNSPAHIGLYIHQPRRHSRFCSIAFLSWAWSGREKPGEAQQMDPVVILKSCQSLQRSPRGLSTLTEGVADINLVGESNLQREKERERERERERRRGRERRREAQIQTRSHSSRIKLSRLLLLISY